MTPRVAGCVRQRLAHANLLDKDAEIGAVTVIEVIPLSKLIMVEPVPLSRLAALHQMGRLSFSRLSAFLANDSMQTDE